MSRFVAWPMPAVATWLAAWCVFLGLRTAPVPAYCAPCIACALSAAAAWAGTTTWRRLLIGGGFPLSFALSGATVGQLPAWAWLAPVAAIAALYPKRLWADAPMFPTPEGALRGLSTSVPLPYGARILDAGCGWGAALHALHAEYPHAQVEGLEWSWLLRMICRLRCPFSQVRREDIWRADWSPYDLIYVFQRPENVQRAFDKAMKELQPGACLVSFEFAVPNPTVTTHKICFDKRAIWIYRKSKNTNAFGVNRPI